MPQRKDGVKRTAIMLEAKRLFAERGFDATSVSDIVSGLGLPVGSVYTYFSGKEELVTTIIEEGWREFFGALDAAMAGEGDPDARLSLIIDTFLPSLFRDVDFISIVLTEAERFAGLKDKMESLAFLIENVISDLATSRGRATPFDRRMAMTALSVFFLGSLDTVRLARRSGFAVDEQDVIAFIKLTVMSSFGPLPS